MNIIKVVDPTSPKATYHVQVQHRRGCQNLEDIRNHRRFGQEAFLKMQELARENSPDGCRVILRVGEFGGQEPGQPLSFDLIGGEVLRTTDKNEYNSNQAPVPSDVASKPDQDCFFDKVIERGPKRPVEKNEKMLVFMPPQGGERASQHLLFIPLAHWRDLYTLEDPAFFGSVFARIVEFSRREEFVGGFRLENNNGPNGGQVIPHFHIHMLGGEKLASPFWQDWKG